MKITTSIVAISIWSILTIFGLVLILYGLISFSVMPAAGVYVALVGLISTNIGIRKIQKFKGELDRKISIGNQETVILGNSRGKAYRTISNLLYLSNFILISILLPDFDGTLGDNLGFIIWAFVCGFITIIYTGIILSIFQSLKWIISIGLLTWSPLFIKTFCR